MRLKTLILHNFRNYTALDVEFSDLINILVGDNASGKSNLLESIYMLSAAKSHRTYLDEELIYHGQGLFYLKGTFEASLGQLVVEISNSDDGNKLIKIDGKHQQKISDMIGRVKAVIFSPESIDIIKGSPSNRRRFLDQLISQISSTYLQNLQTYQSVWKQRNELLKQIRDEKSSRNLIEPWDVQIAEAGMYIISVREKIIEKLAELCSSKHYQLTQNTEELDISYKPSIDLSKLAVRGGNLRTDPNREVEGLYRKVLGSALEKDINMGTTTIGPHRDDIDILVDGFSAKRFCSQGQQRTIVLSIKLAEMELISSELDEQPILLLDDVASELDETRAELVYKLINRLGIQTFITTTKLDNLKDHLLECKNYYKFIVENDTIKKADI